MEMLGCNKVTLTPLSQSSYHNTVQYCYILTVSVLLEQPCNKPESPIKLVTSCKQLVLNLLQQLEQAVRTQLVNSL